MGSSLLTAALLIRGVALGLWDVPADKDATELVRPRLAEIAALGADHVEIVVHWRQKDIHASKLAPDTAVTIPDARLREVLREAARQKLDVLLFPIVDVETRAKGAWRGTLAPKDVDAWWKSYEAFVLHYAAIAAEEEVALYSIGSELGSTEAWRDRWYHLISRVEKIYDGPLVYSANWDHYGEVSFWTRVDYVGINAYHELTTDAAATLKELRAAWVKERDVLVAFAKEQAKPLLITEIGYPSLDGAAVHPWDYTSDAKVDLEEQRRCYQAFADAWAEEPALAGVFFWVWYGEGGKKDRSYTPRGKPAEKVLKAWFNAD